MMKRVRLTQNPSFKQIENMAKNLNERYNGFSTIQTMSWVFKSGTFEVDYWIDVIGGKGWRLESWQELQAKYRELIQRKPEED